MKGPIPLESINLRHLEKMLYEMAIDPDMLDWCKTLLKEMDKIYINANFETPDRRQARGTRMTPLEQIRERADILREKESCVGETAVQIADDIERLIKAVEIMRVDLVDAQSCERCKGFALDTLEQADKILEGI